MPDRYARCLDRSPPRVGCGPPAPLPSPAVENAQAADRAGVVVRPLDACGEHSIAERPIRYLFYEWAVSKQLSFVRRFLPKDPKSLRVVCLRFEACGQDEAVFAILQEPNGTAEAPFVGRAVGLSELAFVVVVTDSERDRPVELQVVADEGVEVVLEVRVGLDVVKESGREVGLTAT